MTPSGAAPRCFKCGREIRSDEEVVYSKEWDVFCHARCYPAVNPEIMLDEECRACGMYQAKLRLEKLREAFTALDEMLSCIESDKAALWSLGSMRDINLNNAHWSLEHALSDLKRAQYYINEYVRIHYGEELNIQANRAEQAMR